MEESIKVLNKFRNNFYNAQGGSLENEVANAINEVLPYFFKLKEDNARQSKLIDLYQELAIKERKRATSLKTKNVEKYNLLNKEISLLTERIEILTTDNERQIIMINDFVKEVHKNAKEHGWWDEERTFGELIVLCHCELSEAIEEFRKGKSPIETYYREKDGKMEGIPSELADVIIRIMDIAGRYGIDLEKTIIEKHEFNKTRPYKHGGKKI